MGSLDAVEGGRSVRDLWPVAALFLIALALGVSGCGHKSSASPIIRSRKPAGDGGFLRDHSP